MIPKAHQCNCGSSDIDFVRDIDSGLPDFICCDDCGFSCLSLPKSKRDEPIEDIEEWLIQTWNSAVEDGEEA